MNPRRTAMRAASALAPAETPDRDKIEALEAEARLLRPYASADGLKKMRARLEEIRLATHRLRGLPLGEIGP